MVVSGPSYSRIADIALWSAASVFVHTAQLDVPASPFGRKRILSRLCYLFCCLGFFKDFDAVVLLLLWSRSRQLLFSLKKTKPSPCSPHATQPGCRLCLLLCRVFMAWNGAIKGASHKIISCACGGETKILRQQRSICSPNAFTVMVPASIVVISHKRLLSFIVGIFWSSVSQFLLLPGRRFAALL